MPDHSSAPTRESTLSASVRVSAHGDMPGTDPVEATRVIRGELGAPHVPHLVELPARGVGADPVGRTVAVLSELSADVRTYGWQLVDAPGHEGRRAESLLRGDINVLADALGAEDAPTRELKTRLRGPLSLARDLFLRTGERALSDHGARRDVAESLAAGLTDHLGALRGAGATRVTVHLDEPGLTDILEGAVPTASGYRTLRSIGRQEMLRAWRTVIQAAREAGADDVVLSTDAAPRSLAAVAEAMTGAECTGIALPISPLDMPAWEQLAELVEGGTSLWLGLIDPRREPPGVLRCVEAVRGPWRSVGLTDASLGRLRLLPTDGFDDVAPHHVRAVLTRLQQTAEALNQIMADA
ncbi:uroporphyrinogen decarboxylase/cobalamine-independent methonine synthase family protein [Zhihengliuella flava]|uniref:Cobalamin-independent methionine synthase MetE C-terminal/archaeal domain-containing protein n=1 Tax=Zhihengliuella flava TaxID=1285193 RepID=A0A931DEZ1_9MICC|nr:hypothetical protein [Zhihengliuella flava]MBG6085605.1 hypothetical protein [Zhihengliuella flava]